MNINANKVYRLETTSCYTLIDEYGELSRGTDVDACNKISGKQLINQIAELLQQDRLEDVVMDSTYLQIKTYDSSDFTGSEVILRWKEIKEEEKVARLPRCKFLDEDNGWCKAKSNWSEAMASIVYCSKECPREEDM